MKNEKGITLIALIITIIVMLILVAVTINVALNGGLFQKAKTAQEETQKETIKEQAEVAKAAAYSEAIKNNTTFGVSDAVTAIAKELEGATSKGTYVEAATKSGTYYVVVDNELKVTVTETEPQAVDDLIPDSNQRADAYTSAESGFFLYNDNPAIMYLEQDGVKIVQIASDVYYYMWCCNELAATAYRIKCKQMVLFR
ncbi:MAG: hypothetical protein J5507_05705 [Clostridia bacterium]|nr:hypothetical protein [Clostridia bacterium]